MTRRIRRLGLIGPVVAAVAVAEAAVLLLRPRDVISPVDVPESAYFSAAQLERARDFVSGQRLLALGALAIQGAVLVALVARPPGPALRLAERMSGRRRLAAGALAGAGLAVALELAPLPLRAWAHERAVDAGLSTQRWGDWLVDTMKGLAITATLTAAIAVVFLILMRRSPRRWWIGGALAVIAIEVLFVWLAPVVIAPLFNRFDVLPQGRTRSDVLALARRADVDVGEVYVVDASRRTRAANAYVTGLGQTKRVVLYDTLLDRFTPAQTRLVVAHELGHVKKNDLFRGMLWVALVAPLGMLVVARLTDRWAGREAVAEGGPAALPALALALALVSFAGGVISNQLSRRIEARADTFALELTHEPRQFIDMERELTVSNLGDPDPPALLHWLFGTHPTAIERIGAGVAFEREQGAGAR
jgi:STE24 endopeptidase